MNFIVRNTSLFLFLISLCSSFSLYSSNQMAKKIFTRINGTYSPKYKNVIAEMSKELESKNFHKAAEMAVQDELFIPLTARDFVSKMLDLEESPYMELNDSIALALGLIYDQEDFRQFLTGDIAYVPGGSNSNVSMRNNTAFANLESSFPNRFYQKLTRVSPQWNTQVAHTAAGVFTTRGWGQIYYDAGTNRRAVKGTFMSFMCKPIEIWRDRGLPDFRVRQDVDRKPGGNIKTFQKECRSCHAPMDAMAGAFAQMDYQNASLVFHRKIAPKYTQNNDVYPEGYITTDTSWMNFAIYRHNKAFGWRSHLEGPGLNSFAQMIAASKGFNKCMAKRVIEQVCYKKIDLENEFVNNSAQFFEQNNYDLKKLFVKVVSNEKCLN